MTVVFGPGFIHLASLASDCIAMKYHSILCQQRCDDLPGVAHHASRTFGCPSQRLLTTTARLHFVKQPLYGGGELLICSDINDALPLILVPISQFMADTARRQTFAGHESLLDEKRSVVVRHVLCQPRPAHPFGVLTIGRRHLLHSLIFLSIDSDIRKRWSINFKGIGWFIPLPPDADCLLS